MKRFLCILLTLFGVNAILVAQQPPGGQGVAQQPPGGQAVMQQPPGGQAVMQQPQAGQGVERKPQAGQGVAQEPQAGQGVERKQQAGQAVERKQQAVRTAATKKKGGRRRITLKERIAMNPTKPQDEALAKIMQEGMERIRRAVPENCSISDMQFIPSGAYIAPDGTAVPNLPSFVGVQYVLKPTEFSHIRCELWLPRPEKWTGDMWGGGNGGAAGGIPEAFLRGQLRQYDAAVTTDMGSNPKLVDVHQPEVWKDYGWRATHLMTVTGKLFTEAFYGRKPSRCYFEGHSTGGNQAMREAQKYPEDYDGILCGVPAILRIPQFIYGLHFHRCCHDSEGKAVFEDRHYENITAATLQYFADKDVPHARGRYVTNPSYTPEIGAAIVKLAAAMEPPMSEEQQRRALSLLAGPVIDGKRACQGLPLGANIKTMAERNIWALKWFFGDDVNFMKITDEQLLAFARGLAVDFNAADTDLSPFFKHGGKLLAYSGTADPICPYHAFLAYFTLAAERMGGWDKLWAGCRYYILPGREHGAKGAGALALVNAQKHLRAWVTKGTAPEAIDARMADGTTMPIAPYPLMTGGSAQEGFKPVEMNVHPMEPPHPFFMYGK